MGSLRVGHDWAASLLLFTFMHWRRKWQPTPVFLPGESQEWGSLVGCHLWGHDWSDLAAAAAAAAEISKLTSSLRQHVIHALVQFSSVIQLCLTLWDSMNGSTPGLLVHHQSWSLHKLMSIESIMPSNHLNLAFNFSQHRSLFQWVSSSHQVAEVLEFQLQIWIQDSQSPQKTVGLFPFFKVESWGLNWWYNLSTW